jgi:eukaryotic-like serine/threonine-protein kinase
VINSLNPGDSLDHFHLENLIAQSGMASIFRATDLRTGNSVAIKVPHPHIECDVILFDRFRREAEICRKLDHPGVVKVLPEDDPSRVYIAMEWIDGRPLREVLDAEKKLPLDRSVKIAIAICGALHYIHSQGVVHRDLKPDNIMLIDAEDRIKLIDFGIAGSLASRRLTFGKFTKTMGTPDYVSPEQVKGKRGDARSDTYSLGAMLYEMLTGEVPFPAPNPLVALNRRLISKPAPPRDINPRISPQLEAVLCRALEREPTNRYATAAEFAFDLEHPGQAGTRKFPALPPEAQVHTPRTRVALSYLMLLMVPVIIWGLLMLVARQH